MKMILLLFAGSVLLWIPVLRGSVDTVWQTVLATMGLWILGGLLAALRNTK